MDRGRVVLFLILTLLESDAFSVQHPPRHFLKSLSPSSSTQDAAPSRRSISVRGIPYDDEEYSFGALTENQEAAKTRVVVAPLPRAAKQVAPTAAAPPGISTFFGAPLISTDDAVDLAWYEMTASGFDTDGRFVSEGSFSKPPIVLLHGLLGSSKNFGTWARELKALHLEPDRRLIVADLRNHGSSPHADSMAYHHMAADVLKLLDTLGVPEAVLLGHSMGGKVAMATAMLAPARVSAVCVIDIAPVRYTKEDGTDWRQAEQMVRQLASLRLESFSSKREADSALARGVLDPQLRQFALMNLDVERGAAAGGGDRLSWRIGLDAIVQELEKIAGADVGGIEGVQPFSGPVVFLKGGASRYIREEAHLRRLSGFFPGAKIETIDGAGHWVHVSKPTELHHAVADFVRNCHSAMIGNAAQAHPLPATAAVAAAAGGSAPLVPIPVRVNNTNSWDRGP